MDDLVSSFNLHLLIAERCLIWTGDKGPPNENVGRHASREMCSPEVSDIHSRRIYKVNRLSAIGHLPHNVSKHGRATEISDRIYVKSIEVSRRI